VLPPPPAMQPVSVIDNPGDPRSEPETGTGDPAGSDRHLRVTGLSIEPIPDQVRGVPFVITLRAEGPEAANFTGQVQISSNKGRVDPNLSNTFSGGVRRQEVVLDKQGGHVVLTVRVGKDLVAHSNPFKVLVR
jgi:hypothetical protein